MKDALLKSRCRGCENGADLLSPEALGKGLSDLPGWQQTGDGAAISRVFEFRDFYKTMAFVNAVAWIANREDHHPDLEIGYGRCKVTYTTHSAGGITQNDLICASSIDRLAEV